MGSFPHRSWTPLSSSSPEPLGPCLVSPAAFASRLRCPVKGAVGCERSGGWNGRSTPSIECSSHLCLCCAPIKRFQVFLFISDTISRREKILWHVQTSDMFNQTFQAHRRQVRGKIFEGRGCVRQVWAAPYSQKGSTPISWMVGDEVWLRWQCLPILLPSSTQDSMGLGRALVVASSYVLTT